MTGGKVRGGWGREEMALRGASTMVAMLLVRSCAVFCMNSFGGTKLFPALGTSPQSPGCDDYGDMPDASRESVLAEEMMQNHGDSYARTGDELMQNRRWAPPRMTDDTSAGRF